MGRNRQVLSRSLAFFCIVVAGSLILQNVSSGAGFFTYTYVISYFTDSANAPAMLSDLNNDDTSLGVVTPTNEVSDEEDDEETKPGDDEETKPGDDEEIEPGDDEETEPGDDEETEPGDDEETKPGDDEETEPGDDMNGEESAEPDEGDEADFKTGESAEDNSDAE